MNKEESKLINKTVDGNLISPVLPDNIKNYLIDIDGTICDDIPNEEPERMETAQLYPEALETLNKWYDCYVLVHKKMLIQDNDLKPLYDDLNTPGFIAVLHRLFDKAKDGNKKIPVMLHRALFGSLERFIGILIENYAGKLPFWLSPAQAVVCPIAEENNDYVKKLFKDLFKEGIKCEMDLRSEKINYKVREHSLAKVPFIIVCGKKEVADNTVTVRKLGSDNQEIMKREDLIKNMISSNKLPLN